MRANRARNTAPELRLRAALRARGIHGYTLHSRSLPGRPDIAFPQGRVAIFVNGCFWHRCPHCRPATPKSHVEFWEAKFATNRKRDRRKLGELRQLGWATLTFWECRIRADPVAAAARVSRRLGAPS